MCATRYALMMLRHASTKAAYDKFRRPIEYPKSGSGFDMRRFVVWHRLHCEWGSCSWALHDDDILTVVTAHGSKSTQLGGMPAEALARILMREIAIAEQAVAPGRLSQVGKSKE